MATSVDLRAERAKLWERAKEILDGAEAENRGLIADEETNWAKTHEDIRALDKRIENLELQERTAARDSEVRTVARPGTAEIAAAGEQPAEGRKAAQSEAFRSWLLYGMGGLTQEQRAVMLSRKADVSEAEVRALSVGVDTAGGYTVPEGMMQQMEQAELAFGGMRESNAHIITTNGGQDIPWPTTNDTGNKGRIIGENTTLTQTDPTVGQKVLRAYMYSSDLVLVPFTLLQDSAIDVEAWLANILAERIGRITNEHFTTGSGADRPSGVVLDATSGVTAVSATEVTADEFLIDLPHSVNRAYRTSRARYMFNDTTAKEVRKLKDGDGKYLWQPGMQTGQPNVIGDYGYVVNDDMPDTATGQKAILFGDFYHYKIRDVQGVTMFTLRERFADSLQVGVFAIARHDGKYVNAGGNPIKAITMA